MNSKEKNERLSVALRKNLKKRKLFQKKLRRKINNVYTARFLDQKNVYKS